MPRLRELLPHGVNGKKVLVSNCRYCTWICGTAKETRDTKEELTISERWRSLHRITAYVAESGLNQAS